MATFKKGVVQVVDRNDLHMDLEVLKFEVPDANLCYLIRLSDARRLSEQADAEVEDSARTHEFARMTILTWYQFACSRIEVDIVADAPFNRTWATTSDTFNYPEPQAE